VKYDFNELDELHLSYAITVHKSQGSEYPVVVLPIHTQHYLMLQRNLLYTAITRSRKLVVLV
jgi:exodeoxyribonuclease V alpha subunit